jgi:hypothetical protein
MTRNHNRTRALSPWRVLLGVLCLGLIVLAGTLSVTHSHAQDGPVHADCGLCVAAHATSHTASVAPILQSGQAFIGLIAAAPLFREQAAIEASLYSRPPPSASYRS